MNAVRVQVGGATLAATFTTPPGTGPHPAVLFAHGWGGSQRQDLGTARRLARHGLACLTFNFRGHARTRRQRETVTRADNLRDLVAAHDLLAAQPGVDLDRIGVVGASYGGYLAVLLTAERRVQWLALRAPAIYKDEDFDRPKRELNLDADLPAYRRRRLAAAENRALLTASRFPGDVLIVESEHDTVIPAPVIANYVDAFAGAATLEHHRLAEADHGLSQPRWRSAYGAILAGWVERTLGLDPAWRRAGEATAPVPPTCRGLPAARGRPAGRR
jgi:dienelactone hydrolase